MRFRVKREFGLLRYYPVDEAAIAMCKISKQKSLTDEQIKILESIGTVITKDVEL